MTAILISIKPKYVEKILSGEKIYEYRRRGARRDCSVMLIYCTAPVCKIIACAQIINQLWASPEELWSMTEPGAGICYEDYAGYFSGAGTAYAYQFGKVVKFSRPRQLSDYGISRPPQSFAYVEIDPEFCVEN